jgi:hypothetical protein
VYSLTPAEIAWVALFASVNFDPHSNKLNSKLKWSSEVAKESGIKKRKIIEYFNTYFVDLAFRVERELKGDNKKSKQESDGISECRDLNNVNIKYPQYQFVDEEPLGLFSQIK